MKTKNTAKEVVKLPISRKAYESFVERIRIVSSKFIGDPSPFIRILDQYLAGEREYLYMSATYEMRIAFEMLRPEIDRAIERSRRARERALARKKRNDIIENTIPIDIDTHLPEVEKKQEASSCSWPPERYKTPHSTYQKCGVSRIPIPNPLTSVT